MTRDDGVPSSASGHTASGPHGPAAGQPTDADPSRSLRPAHPDAGPGVRRRGWLEIRWRQFRNAPRPIVRAVLASLIVASVLGVAYLLYDVAIIRGAQLPGGDLRTLFVTIYVAIVLVSGALVTWLIVPQPTGGSLDRRPRRTPWSAALGFFAAVPIAYLVLVVVTQVIEPLIT
jgi:hypothetical protein